MNAQYIDTKWTVTGYFGELWYAEEEDILGKQQEFFKGWADGVFYSCDYAGQSATYNSYKIKEFIENKEFELVNQDNAFSKVFTQNGLTNENSKVFVHRITCNGKKVVDRKVLYPFITVDGFNKCVPRDVPGIVFLSGGQADELATAHLDAINKMGPLSWKISFSYGRALQAAPLKTWSGKPENISAAQAAFTHRASMNKLAAF
mgnify:CR=1 FL=1